MLLQENMSVSEKLQILSDAAKYDVACTSSGVDKKNGKAGIGNASACGICHSFAADGRCISLLKILFTNECIFDCKYCINRASNDVKRASFTPDEVCRLTIEFYRRNYIEGLFLSSGIIESPNNTMELLYQTVWKLRNEYHFMGYIHVKGIPGADPAIIERVGYVTDRMSVNLELPTAEGLRTLAPHKNRKNILTPIRQIQNGINSSKNELVTYSERNRYLGSDSQISRNYSMNSNTGTSRFVPAGQSTQMIIGATPENDYQIISVAEALYKNYELKRVFYSAFVSVNQDSSLPATIGGPPLLREHRLYQADWLLRFYGFEAKELLSEKHPNFNVSLDPKCDWAVSHLEHFPVEINRADYYTILRVPGIGVKSARRIVAARKYAKLDFTDLKKMGVVLKRALYFITCGGKMMYDTRIDEQYITRHLIYNEKPTIDGIEEVRNYKQLSLFDDVKHNPEPTMQDKILAITGQL